MKTVIIPDIHCRIVEVDRILTKETPYDKVVFIGDYFDGRPDGGPSQAREVARWLKHSLGHRKHVHLYGNHDVAYGYTGSVGKCSGWLPSKDTAVWEVMGREDFDKIKFFHVEQGWLISHAGLHPYFLPPMWKKEDFTLKNVEKYLTAEVSKFEIKMAMNERHWFLICGDSRRYYPEGIDQGGLLWCDVTEFHPIEGIAQIFGHTARNGGIPTVIRGDTGLDRQNTSEVFARQYCPTDGWNVCLDTFNKSYGVIENGVLTLKSAVNNENPTQK